MSAVKDKHLERLGQEDILEGEYLERVIDKYSPLIGLSLIKFSYLEHELNLAIAEWFADDLHEIGYTIIEKLRFYDKIQLFYKLYVREESLLGSKRTKTILDEIKQKLESINTFRNSIVHANWQSLSRDGFIRTKIVVDKQEGEVKLKRIKITPKIIRQNIKEIDNLLEKIEEYKDMLAF